MPSIPFRLLHASDFHIARHPYQTIHLGTQLLQYLAQFPFGNRYQNFLMKLANLGRQTSQDPNVLAEFWRFVWVLDQQQAFDAVLITGDLATTGKTNDLRTAYRELTQTNRGPLIQGNRLQLLPGNHDRFRGLLTLFKAGNVSFDAQFCPPLPRTRFWCARRGIQAFAIPRGNHVLHVIQADFSLERNDKGKRFFGLPGWLGQGRVDAALLQSLVAATQKAHAPDRTILWALHFDPTTTDGTLELLDSRLLRQEIEKLQSQGIYIPAILCGHTHESKMKPLTANTTIFVCGTTTQAYADHGNDCQLVELHIDPTGQTNLQVTWYRYDIHLGQFLSLGSARK